MRRSALAVALSTAALSPAAVAATAGATPVADWTAPAALGVDGHTNLYPLVSMGAAGDVTVGVRDYTDERLAVQSHPAGGTWSTATPLSTAGRKIAVFQVATSPADDAAVAIWGENTPQSMGGPPGMTMPGPDNIMVAAKAAGGAWGTPEALTPAGGDPMTAPSIALAADGRAVAIWFDGTHGAMNAAIRATDGAWGAPQVIGTGTGHVNASAIVLRPDGSAVAVWQRDYDLEAAVVHGSAWAPVTTLGQGAVPQLGVDDDGDVTVAYVGSNGMSEDVRTIDADDRWAAPRQISVDGALSYYESSLGVAPDGTAVLTWPQVANSTYSQMVSRRDAGGTWTAPQALAAGTSETPAATAADGGRAIVSYRSLGSPSVLTGTIFDGSAWGSAFPVSGSNPGGFQDLAGDGRGSAVVVYMENGSAAKVAFHDGSGPSLRNLVVPSAGTAGTGVDVSVDPRDAVSALGATTWDFGDGTATASGTSASHAYGAAGTYTVTVTSEDALGHATTRTRTIVVSAPAGHGGGAPGTPAPADDTTAAPEPDVRKTTPAPAPAPAPQPAPAPAPKATAPAAPSVMLAHRQKLATLLARQAIRTTVAAPSAGAIKVTATVSRAAAKRLGLKSTRLSAASTKVKAGTSTSIALKLSSSVRERAAKLKTLTITLTVTFVSADGHRTTTRTTLSTRA